MWGWAKSGTRQWRLVQLAERLTFLSEDLRYRYWLVDRPHYAYGVHRAIDAARRLGLRAVTVIEFGVAGGAGLVALERHAAYLGKLHQMDVRIAGFDSGVGLPASTDHRDQPYRWAEGFYAMDEVKLRSRLDRTDLVIGPVKETIPAWIEQNASELASAPVGFVSFDLDYYSSTVEAFDLFRTDHLEVLLPRVFTYFDDVVFSIASIGELEAIAEFNANHVSERAIGQIFGLRPGIPFDPPWAEQCFEFHCFIHPRYRDTVEAAPKQLPL